MSVNSRGDVHRCALDKTAMAKPNVADSHDTRMFGARFYMVESNANQAQRSQGHADQSAAEQGVGIKLS